MNDFQLSKNFNLQEFVCHDGSNLVMVDEFLVKKLQALRDMIGAPIEVVSGYRTPEYNKQVGGVDDSQHLYGKAADIKVSGYDIKTIAALAEKIGFDGIGTYRTFVHVDVRGYTARWEG